MSIKKWPGAVVSDVKVEPAGAYQNSAASGVWTLEQQAYWEAQGLWPVPGSINPDSYIENLFSTYLYTGNSSTQTITNGIDLANEGGLVWLKSRGPTGYNHYLYDTNRGATYVLFSNLTNSYGTQANGLTAFNNNGFTQGSFIGSNGAGENYVSWTFRKAPKFFDVVTYTGNGVAGRQIAHNLGSKPGFIIVKRTDTGNDPYNYWRTAHIVGGTLTAMDLNTTAEASTTPWGLWSDSATPTSAYAAAGQTSTYFTVGSNASINGSGGSFVAYLFAHDAGGFGDDGLQNVISCGSFTTDGSGNATVNLGYEPQWILQKSASGSNPIGNWFISDVMRGMPIDFVSRALRPNLPDVESSGGTTSPTATGFSNSGFQPTTTYIYVAIRRGPMKTPTSGTEVFAPVTYTGTGTTGQNLITGFPVDMFINADRTSSVNMRPYAFPVFTRILSLNNAFATSKADSWGGGWGTAYWNDTSNTSLILTDGSAPSSYNNQTGVTFVNWCFRRAPGFFDVVRYTGTGVARTVTHNLGIAPELMLVKRMDVNDAWAVYFGDPTDYLRLNDPQGAVDDVNRWNDTAPTSTVFTVGTDTEVNVFNSTYCAYLFATVAGVSKFGSYAGTGANINVDCGFSSGARFILIKRTDPASSGDWFVWDSARGIVAGNEPYLRLNLNSGDVTDDYIDPLASGFTVTSLAPAALNTSGGNYIFLAIA